MRATLYEALGISRDASDAEVRAALRSQIRKNYTRTRDGKGNVEEALRFINHASRILTDPELRAQYDQDLAASDGNVDERIAHVVQSAVGRGRKRAVAGGGPAAATTSVGPPARRARTGDTVAPKVSHHPALTERVVAIRPSTAVAFALSALFGVFIAVAIALVTPAESVQVAKQLLVWATVLLLALSVLYAVVHGIAWTQRRHHAATPTLTPATDLAILNWRRQKTVFLGTNQPQEDASWVFQLRMAELERAKLGRTSEPRPWHRLAARLFDYALWGLMLAVPFSELRSLGVIGPDAALWIGHPMLAPVVITASWIPLEAALIAVTQTTPGKWLFSVYLQFSISDAYAARDTWTQFRRALARAARVWWQGIACGFLPLAPILIAIAYEKVGEYQETPWDFAEDCLVTHGPVVGLNAVTGIGGLAAMFWLYGIAWYGPMEDSIAWARARVEDAVRSPPTLLSRGLRGGSGSDTARTVPREAGQHPASSASTSGEGAAQPSAPASPDAATPIDPQLAAVLAAREERLAALSTDGPRLLDAGRYGQAAELCGEWADLDLANANAWRCLGRALDALGRHRQALAAFRRAKQFDPHDAALDAAIARSERGIIADFRARAVR
jgi:cytochrome b561